MVVEYPHVIIKYELLKYEDRYEYAPDKDPLWSLSNNWICITYIKADTVQKGYGSRALILFLNQQPTTNRDWSHTKSKFY